MSRILAGFIFLICGMTAVAADVPEDRWDWDVWRALPVQHGGRRKPLDTVARESLRMLANRGTQVDPQTGNRLEPIAWYLTMLFDWGGWEHHDRAELELVVDWRQMYFHLHPADKWDREPLLRVDFPPLANALGLRSVNHIAPQTLADQKMQDRDSTRKIPYSTWAETLRIAEESGQELTEFERKGRDLAERLWSYQNHRMGCALEILPNADQSDSRWMPLAHVLLPQFDDASDPTGDLRKAQALFLRTRKSFHDRDVATFNTTSQEFVELMRRMGNAVAGYPSQTEASLEVAYNRWTPFRYGWIFMLGATVSALLQSGLGWRWLYRIAQGCYLGGLIAILIGFGLRVAITGRPPVTNMYESVIYVGAGVAIFGGLFERISKNSRILIAAGVVATIALVLADNCPLLLDSSVRPLEPVLRNNFWLVTHVMTITLSYAALALGMGIANLTLACYLRRTRDLDMIASLSRLTYKTIQIGVLLLSAGIILGGVWADYSWGRFWGWDPKEVWALISLLGYLAVLHARYAGWVGHRGLAALSVACFALIVMAWYGVNFILGAGLHSYGFGGGGQGYVYSAVGAQFVFVAISLARSVHTSVDPEPMSLGRDLTQLRPALRYLQTFKSKNSSAG